MNFFSADSRESNAKAGWMAGLKREEGHNCMTSLLRAPNLPGAAHRVQYLPPAPSESKRAATCHFQESSWCRGVGVGVQLVTSAQHRASKLYIKASFATNKPVLTAKHIRGWFVVWVFVLVWFLNIHKLQHNITG